MLHFAVTGGNVDTTKLLLERFPKFDFLILLLSRLYTALFS